MKVIYATNYRDGTGWAHFGLNQILALDAVDIDVVPRVVKLNRAKPHIPARVVELEKKSCSGADVIIQNTLPSFFQYTNKVKNIGYFTVETNNFRATTWADRANIMDEIWVPCDDNATACDNSGVTKNVQVIPMATDTSKYYRSYEPLPFLNQFKDKYIFYYVGELSRRKNIEAILRAFHMTFSPTQPVELLIKTTPTGLGDNPQETINNILLSVKRGLKLYSSEAHYKKEIVICDYFEDEQLNRLHNSCDCFVTASRGEGWCIPAFDAMGFGRQTILPRHSAFLDWTNNSTNYLVSSRPEPVFGAADAAFSDIYTSEEIWNEVDIANLAYMMKRAYLERELKNTEEFVEECRGVAEQFSLARVGEMMKAAL